MTSLASKNIWIRRQQCPCGDWRCCVRCEGETEEASIASQLGKNEAVQSEAMVAPYVGMIFKTDDAAFEYYGNFARRNGFSIRKERSRLSPQLGIYKRDFVCYRSGFAPARKKSTGDHHRDRKSVRCGCDAKMYLSKEVVEGLSQWFVVQFSNVHNHELLEDDQVRLLPAYRKIQDADQERILLLSKAGFPIHRIVRVLELEKGIQGGQLPFLERDVRNFVQNRRKIVQENDALLNEKRENDTMELLEACKAMKVVDEQFAFDFTLDENDKVENVAWSYGDSIHAYTVFGDVVYFDISYRSITYGMLFGAWLGIDNNGKMIFFGCVLLQEETPHSFAWALQAFIHLMKGKCPQTIVAISANSDDHTCQGKQYMLCRTSMPIEDHARTILTPFAFNSLQQELLLAMQYAADELGNGSYLVHRFKKVDGERLVIWIPEDEQIHCSCKAFESSGILCRHALRVFIMKNYFQLPEKYYPIRWQRASSLALYDDPDSQASDDEWFHNYQSLTKMLFRESSVTKKRYAYVRHGLPKELTRLLNEVRKMPESDGAAVELTHAPTG